MGEQTTRHIALGTAGHIDHGKTTLVKRLTGVDTDRLPEERKRGITIVLGFAPLILPDGTRVGLVDVPGHERFVKNMVAGAGGVDVVLLVVAADEGVMPQTREHLEICQLLGIEHGVVALTKIDRAGPELTELAREDVRAHLAATQLANAPIVPCSSITGEGIDTLLAELTTVVRLVRDRSGTDLPALPIDRVFSVKGFGTVVTGTLRSGSLGAGDSVEILPPIPGRELDGTARIRSVQVFHEPVDRAHAGDRTALNLHNVELDQLSPGQLVVAPGTARPTRLADVELQYLASRNKPLKSGARVLLHAGTAIVEAGVTLLDADRLEPGARGPARLRLRERIAVLPGQRFILRGFDRPDAAGRTLGGGVILDPEPVRRRRHQESTRLVLEGLAAHLRALGPERGERRTEAAVLLVRERGARGQSLPALSRRLGLQRELLTRTLERAAKDQSVVLLDELAVDPAALRALGERLLAIIDAYHREHPYRGAMSLAELTTRAGRAIPGAIVERAARQLAGMKKLAVDPEGFRRPDHASAARAGGDVRAKVQSVLEAAGLEPPSLSELERQSGLDPKALRELLAAMTRAGDLVRATPELYFTRKSFEAARDLVLAHLEQHGELSTADAKTLTQLSRKYLIPLLEALDKAQITVRTGETRRAGKKPRVSSP